jgi:hypothetical protein
LYRYTTAKHVMEGKREMLALIQKHPDGILMDDVTDAYQLADEDAEELIAGAMVISLAGLMTASMLHVTNLTPGVGTFHRPTAPPRGSSAAGPA